MDTGTRAMRITPVQRVCWRKRRTHLGIECRQVVERAEVWLRVRIVAHADEVQQHTFERCVPCTLPLAQGGPIDHRTASPRCRQAVSNDQPHIVVRVEFQIFRRQAYGTKRRKNPRYAAWQGDILLWESQTHCVAYAEFGTEASWGTNFLHGLNKPLYELHEGAGSVFEMEAWTNARIHGDTDGVKVGLRRLPASAGFKFMKRVLI
jgi:hypothetical protein